MPIWVFLCWNFKKLILVNFKSGPLDLSEVCFNSYSEFGCRVRFSESPGPGPLLLYKVCLETHGLELVSATKHEFKLAFVKIQFN